MYYLLFLNCSLPDYLSLIMYPHTYSDVGNIGKIQICYDLLTKEKVVEKEIVEVEPPTQILEPVQVLVLPIKKVIPKKRHW